MEYPASPRRAGAKVSRTGVKLLIIAALSLAAVTTSGPARVEAAGSGSVTTTDGPGQPCKVLGVYYKPESKVCPVNLVSMTMSPAAALVALPVQVAVSVASTYSATLPTTGFTDASFSTPLNVGAGGATVWSPTHVYIFWKAQPAAGATVACALPDCLDLQPGSGLSGGPPAATYTYTSTHTYAGLGRFTPTVMASWSATLPYTLEKAKPGTLNYQCGESTPTCSTTSSYTAMTSLPTPWSGFKVTATPTSFTNSKLVANQKISWTTFDTLLGAQATSHAWQCPDASPAWTPKSDWQAWLNAPLQDVNYSSGAPRTVDGFPGFRCDRSWAWVSVRGFWPTGFYPSYTPVQNGNTFVNATYWEKIRDTPVTYMVRKGASTTADTVVTFPDSYRLLAATPTGTLKTYSSTQKSLTYTNYKPLSFTPNPTNHQTTGLTMTCPDADNLAAPVDHVNSDPSKALLPQCQPDSYMDNWDVYYLEPHDTQYTSLPDTTVVSTTSKQVAGTAYDTTSGASKTYKKVTVVNDGVKVPGAYQTTDSYYSVNIGLVAANPGDIHGGRPYSGCDHWLPGECSTATFYAFSPSDYWQPQTTQTNAKAAYTVFSKTARTYGPYTTVNATTNLTYQTPTFRDGIWNQLRSSQQKPTPSAGIYLEASSLALVVTQVQPVQGGFLLLIIGGPLQFAATRRLRAPLI